jgi:N-methylhydantoinase A
MSAHATNHPCSVRPPTEADARITRSGVEIGIDVGGTFTDVVCRDQNGVMRFVKIPSTRHDSSKAVLASIDYMSRSWGLVPEQIRKFAHGTTVATNAVLERKGARAAVLTTAGFRDILEIGRQMRRQMYNPILAPETPGFLAPGARRKEITERISATGEIIVPLDADSVLRAIDELKREGGVQAIAVVLLFSFVNPAHEHRVHDMICDLYPGVDVSLSHDVDPTFREYERTVATTFDAYVKPVIDHYLLRMENGLQSSGVTAPLQIMQSRGGLMVSKIARQRPIRMFLSGPAAGVIGARLVGRSAGIDDLISVDIGGTSCDVAMINKGEAIIRTEGEIAGFPVRVGMVDVNSIGAGGGSIAWLDHAKGLRVGPESAGSEPGPACYNRGGTDPTVTDASIVLGYIDPDYFAGGSLKLNPQLARKAIQEEIADPMGIGIDRAALGIHRVLNAQMSEAIRLISIRQGIDPRGFTLLPLGGGGAVHAAALARELNIRRILIPRVPGVLSAAGLLAAPIEHEATLSFPRALHGLPIAEVVSNLRTLDVTCAALMAEEHVDPAVIQRTYLADVCYIGQSYTLEIPIVLDHPDPTGKLYDDFLRAHDRIYGHSTSTPACIVNLRSIHRVLEGAHLEFAKPTVGGGSPQKSKRRILLAGATESVEAGVFDRDALPAGFEFIGPAIVEQHDTTTVVDPGWCCRIDQAGNIIMTC